MGDMETTTPETTRRWKVLGTTEDAAGCDCCGRTNLKVYVALEPIDGGEVVFMGTTCAAKAEKVTVKVIRDEVTAAEKARREAEAAIRKAQADAEDADFFAWVKETHGVEARQAADLWDKVPGFTPFTLRVAWRTARAS